MKKFLSFFVSVLFLLLFPLWQNPVMAQNNLNCYINSFNTCVIDLSVPSSCNPGFVLPNCSPYPDCCQKQNTLGTCSDVACIPIGATATPVPSPIPTQTTNPCTISGNLCYPTSCPPGQTRLSFQCIPATNVCCTNAPPTACPPNGSCRPTCNPITEVEFNVLNNSCNALTPPQKCCLPNSNSNVGGGPPIVTCNGGAGFVTAIGCIPVESPQAFATFFIKWAMGIAGGIALALIGYAGFMITTSMGNPQKLQAGKELLTAAIMGLALLLFGIFALRFIGIEILKLNLYGFGT